MAGRKRVWSAKVVMCFGEPLKVPGGKGVYYQLLCNGRIICYCLTESKARFLEKAANEMEAKK